jgi:nitroreductase
VELYEVMRTTSAVRHFTNDPLPDEILYTILDNARFAPSGGNRQGTRIVIIRDPDTRQALVEVTIPATKKYVAQRQAGENPWNTIYPSRVSDGEIAAAEVPESFIAPLLQAGVVLVVCVDLRVVAALDEELDRVGIVGRGFGLSAGMEHLARGAKRRFWWNDHDHGGGGRTADLPVTRDP